MFLHPYFLLSDASAESKRDIKVVREKLSVRTEAIGDYSDIHFFLVRFNYLSKIRFGLARYDLG